MATCPDCGNDHGERSPATSAWADQMMAEVRDNARGLYVEAISRQLGRPVAFTEDSWAALDPLFRVGADAMLIALTDHGALKQAER